MEELFFYFIFDGNFPELALSEFTYLFSAIDKEKSFQIIYHSFDILVFKIDVQFIDIIKKLQKYSRLTSLTKEMGFFYLSFDFKDIQFFDIIIKNILQQINEKMPKFKIKPNSSFKVELIKRGIIDERLFSSENRQKLIFSIADAFIDNFNLKADLSNEEITITIIIMPNNLILGQKLFKPNRKEIMNRTPSNRAYFHSGSMNPILIRSMINLGLKKNYFPDTNDSKKRLIFLDPFMGAGGILMEAGTMGFSTLGIELGYWMSRGARMNLTDLTQRGYPSFYWSIIRSDSNKIPLKDNCIDFIVTDPPYGHSTILGGQKLEDLLKNVLKECHRVLKSESRMVISIPSQITTDFYKFLILEKISDRVHSSLTRIIYLLEKN